MTEEKRLFLHVSVPPKIAPFNFNKDVSEGVRAQVTCMIEQGDSPFKILWSKDGVTIPNTPSSNYDNTGTNGLRVTSMDAHSSTIFIENVTAAHTGNYTCVASNSVAEVTWTAELVVSGK